jgi:hypothetical protein
MDTRDLPAGHGFWLGRSNCQLIVKVAMCGMPGHRRVEAVSSLRVHDQAAQNLLIVAFTVRARPLSIDTTFLAEIAKFASHYDATLGSVRVWCRGCHNQNLMSLAPAPNCDTFLAGTQAELIS